MCTGCSIGKEILKISVLDIEFVNWQIKIEKRFSSNYTLKGQRTGWAIMREVTSLLP